ncbi:pyrroloquinoline quinone biosynthesis peptide chaperone PqqD [Streptomyces sp. NPDC050636]|uniref:pyrroloquinoline quinone biosynthesis peptide chaperone PqqD n=1 Tax=Streptomyces sp. NPDC050636 TaxID=3154510 RepID=UPI00343189B5
MLAPAVVLRHDQVCRRDLLIVPERVVVLNRQAGAVLRLCDGTRSVAEIVAELASRYPTAPVASDVPDFLHRICREGWIR